MSFKCMQSNEIVMGQRKILIPTHVRTVKYNYFTENNDRRATEDNKLIWLKTTTGFETVKEVPVSEKNVENFLKINEVINVGEKKVDITVKLNFEKPRYRKYDEDDNDKPEF